MLAVAALTALFFAVSYPALAGSSDRAVSDLKTLAQRFTDLERELARTKTSYDFHKGQVEFYTRDYEDKHKLLQQRFDAEADALPDTPAGRQAYAALVKQYDEENRLAYARAVRNRAPHVKAANEDNLKGMRLTADMTAVEKNVAAIRPGLHARFPACKQGALDDMAAEIACYERGGSPLAAADRQALTMPLMPEKFEPSSPKKTLPVLSGAAASVRGDVFVVYPDGRRVRVKPGTPIMLNDHVITGPDGRLHVLLLDQTVFTLGADSDMVIDEFVYDPHPTVMHRVKVSLLVGTIRLVTALFGRGHETQIRVASGSLGFRGTDAVVSVGKDGSGYVALFKGLADLTTGKVGTTLSLTAGHMIYFGADGARLPVPIDSSVVKMP